MSRDYIPQGEIGEQAVFALRRLNDTMDEMLELMERFVTILEMSQLTASQREMLKEKKDA